MRTKADGPPAARTYGFAPLLTAVGFLRTQIANSKSRGWPMVQLYTAHPCGSSQVKLRFPGVFIPDFQQRSVAIFGSLLKWPQLPTDIRSNFRLGQA
jgi:hypothetical protein